MITFIIASASAPSVPGRIGEDQQLPAAVVLQPQVVPHVQHLGQLPLCPSGLGLLGEGKQRQQRRLLGFQFRDRLRQPLLQGLFLKLPAAILVEIIEILAVSLDLSRC